MTETSVPFDSAPAAPSPESGLEPAQESSNRSRLVLLGGVAGVVLLGILGYFLFFTGGDAEPAADTAATPVAPSQPGDAVVPPAAEPQQKLNARSFGRDPFKALIVEAPAAVRRGPVVAPVTSPSTTGDTSTGGTSSASPARPPRPRRRRTRSAS